MRAAIHFEHAMLELFPDVATLDEESTEMLERVADVGTRSEGMLAIVQSSSTRCGQFDG
jgi:hypothetical protein